MRSLRQAVLLVLPFCGLNLGAASLSTSYSSAVVSRPNRYDYAPTAIRQSGWPHTSHLWFGAAEVANGTDFNDAIKHSINSASYPLVVLCPSQGGTNDASPPFFYCTTDYPTGPEVQHVNDPSVIILDGQYWMYYTGPQIGNYGLCGQIFLARGPAQGLEWWTKYPDSAHPPQPIIPYPCPPSPNISVYGIGEPSISFRDGQFVLYYTLQNSWEDRRTWRATSSDGITFVNHQAIYPSSVDASYLGGDVKYLPHWNAWFLVSGPTFRTSWSRFGGISSPVVTGGRRRPTPGFRGGRGPAGGGS